MSKAKSSNLTPLEIAVCRRLGEARKLLRLSQVEVADRLGISRDRWASWESARAPIKFFWGFLFCLEFKLSPAWLATGKGRQNEPEDYLVETTLSFPGSLPFGFAYENHLRGNAIKKGAAARPLPDPGSKKACYEGLIATLETCYHSIPAHDFEDFTRLVWHTSNEFLNKRALGRQRARAVARKMDFDPVEHFKHHEKRRA